MLKTLGHKRLTFQLAIRRLESPCLFETRRDVQGSVTNASVHSTVCKWRLETIDEQEREDYIMLAAVVLSQGLPDVGMDAVSHLRHISLIKYSYDLMQQHIEPRNLEAPNSAGGQLYQQDATVTARYA